MMKKGLSGNIWKSLIVIRCSNGLKEKYHVCISVNAEKGFVKNNPKLSPESLPSAVYRAGFWVDEEPNTKSAENVGENLCRSGAGIPYIKIQNLNP